MNMVIRKAISAESDSIAPLIFLAMEDIVYYFIGERVRDNAIQLLSSLIRETNNQYSFENCWVIETDNQIVAAAIVYNGADLAALRAPVLAKIKQVYNRNLNLENETEPGEYYIDCIGVDPAHQGKGLGSKIIAFLVQEFVGEQNEILGLLVDKNNPGAKRLYLKSGFAIVGEKKLAGKEMEHLQISKQL
ncbi:GNAT family N-acetyltransferase [Terrimonas ferruginea]|uniref:GNAT family N-acetyltransferase n=1 Tax=Terrimonas ferruginea TaxID=249 RepID=UPI001B7FDB77|nr:GNAT family N-acetyltransferase [Terrimonas ferruginea]